VKTYGKLNVQIHVFLTSALVVNGWLVSCPTRFIPEERTRYPLDRGLGVLESRSGVMEKRKTTCPCRKQNPDCFNNPNNRTARSNAYCSCFVLGKSPVRILCLKSSKFAEICLGIPESLQAYVRIMYLIVPWTLPSTSFRIYCSWIVLWSFLHGLSCWWRY
jgi:hypothetical protein